MDKIDSFGHTVGEQKLVLNVPESLPQSLSRIAQVALFQDNMMFDKLEAGLRS